jgi:hypothetical protein
MQDEEAQYMPNTHIHTTLSIQTTQNTTPLLPLTHLSQALWSLLPTRFYRINRRPEVKR